ncbi:hypothetical protein TRIUR3_03982 [Triticum urartu]|uniref:Rx N-terminal domain-containing protein n=1 Tax=Triticum urartu TaxID=4572 RepID=M7ZLK0_TRIUA|nr:hypothetical protein TRIUR3_03982 [Triticum urartu]
MEMKMAVSAANWLVGKVLSKLSDGLVSTYMASSELGSNFLNAKNQLMYTQGLLSASVGRDVGDDPGLRGLLGTLSKKADEAEDVLDELHYFMIQHFGGSTGYGHDDAGGREALESVFAHVVGAEAAELAADGGLDWDALAHAVRPETGR